MNRVEPPVTPDDERPVDLTGDEFLLPEQSVDDTDHGWGEQKNTNDERLWEDVPPHWS